MDSLEKAAERLQELSTSPNGVVFAESRGKLIRVHGTAPWQEIVNFAIGLKKSNPSSYVNVDIKRCPMSIF